MHGVLQGCALLGCALLGCALLGCVAGFLLAARGARRAGGLLLVAGSAGCGHLVVRTMWRTLAELTWERVSAGYVWGALALMLGLAVAGSVLFRLGRLRQAAWMLLLSLSGVWTCLTSPGWGLFRGQVLWPGAILLGFPLLLAASAMLVALGDRPAVRVARRAALLGGLGIVLWNFIVLTSEGSRASWEGLLALAGAPLALHIVTWWVLRRLAGSWESGPSESPPPESQSRNP